MKFLSQEACPIVTTLYLLINKLLFFKKNLGEIGFQGNVKMLISIATSIMA
jgi:hypothetical protein